MAWACAEAGRVEEGRVLVTRVRGATFGALRRDYLWLATLVNLSRACTRLVTTVILFVAEPASYQKYF